MIYVGEFYLLSSLACRLLTRRALPSKIISFCHHEYSCVCVCVILGNELLLSAGISVDFTSVALLEFKALPRALR